MAKQLVVGVAFVECSIELLVTNASLSGAQWGACVWCMCAVHVRVPVCCLLFKLHMQSLLMNCLLMNCLLMKLYLHRSHYVNKLKRPYMNESEAYSVKLCERHISLRQLFSKTSMVRTKQAILFSSTTHKCCLRNSTPI